MTRLRAAAFVACVILIAASAAADSSFQSSSVTIDGRATIEGIGGAVFVIVAEDGILWNAQAEAAQLERTHVGWTAVPHPADDEAWLATLVDPTGPKTEVVSFSDVSLQSGAWRQGGAILVRAPDSASVRVVAEGFSVLQAQTDPRFDQADPPTVEVNDDEDLSIHEGIQGEYLNSTLPGGDVEITGDLVVTVYGLDYAIAGEEKRTGQFETSETGGVVQGSDERHVITLSGATLRLRSHAPLYVLTADSVVTYVGSAAASDQAGAALPLETGASTLTLTAAGGLLAITAPGASAAGEGALVARGPALGPVALALVALALVATLALVAWRRRERADDLPMALLAMEERRWGDALPRLTRLASRRPQDVGILVDRALCLEQLGQHKDAARAFERALRASPRHAEAHFYYARTLARLQQRDAGLVHLETALELDPRLSEMARREPVLRGL